MTNRISISEKAKTLAWRVVSSRDDLGWSQEVLADKAGVSRTSVSGIESGRNTNTTVYTIFALADALGVSRAYLLGMTDDPLGGIQDSPIHKKEVEEIDEALKQLLNIYQQLNESQRSTLLNIAKVLQNEPRVIGKET